MLPCTLRKGKLRPYERGTCGNLKTLARSRLEPFPMRQPATASDPDTPKFPSPRAQLSPPQQGSSFADLSHLCVYYYGLIKMICWSRKVPEKLESPH